MKTKYNPTIKDVYDDLQKVKKLLGILLDKENIRQSDLDNHKRERDEAKERSNAMMERTLKYMQSNTRKKGL